MMVLSSDVAKKTGSTKHKNYAWNTIGTSLSAFISLFLLIVATRINGIYDAGLFSFAFSMSLIFFSVGSFGGRLYQVSDTDNEFDTLDYIFLKSLTTLIMLVLAILMVIINQYDIIRTGLIISLVIFKACEIMSDVLYAVMQRHQKLYQAGISLAIKAMLGFVMFFLIDLTTHNLLLATVQLFIANGLVIVLYDIPKVRKIESLKFRFNEFKVFTLGCKEILLKNFQVFAASFLLAFIANVSKYIMDFFYPEFNGFFGIITMLATMMLLIAGFLLQPVVVDISESHKNRAYNNVNSILNRLFLFSVGFGILALIITYFFGVGILSFIYAVDISSLRFELCLVIVGGIINIFAVIYYNVLTIMRELKKLLFVYAFSSILMVLLCMILIPRFIVIGGVLATIMINLFQAVVFMAIYFRKTKQSKAKE